MPDGRDRRSVGARGQVEPLPALVAVAVVGAALSLYAGSLAGALPGDDGRSVADATLVRASDRLLADGVAAPDDLGRARAAAPDGYAVNATIDAGDRRWSVGPTPPTGAASASRPVGVRRSPTAVDAGRLRVVVWS